MKINKKYTERDFETDIYNVLILSNDKEAKYIRRPAWYLMKKFIKNKEWILAEKMREIVKDFNNEGPT